MGLHQRAGHSVMCVTALLCLRIHTAGYCIDNQKNGWKGVCVYHETNGAPEHCPVRALGRRYLHLRHHGATPKTFLSTFHNVANKRCDITNEDITADLKRAATVLDYPIAKGISIARIDTHSPRSGGANALSLAGFSDTQIRYRL